MATRLFLAGIILVLAGFKLHGKGSLRVFRKKRDTIHLLALIIFGITSRQFIYLMVIQASDTGTITVLQYLSPILVLVMMHMRELRLPKGFELVAVGPSLFGTFIAGTHGDIYSFHVTGEAPFWGFLAAVSSIIYTTMPGGLIPKHDICRVLGFDMFFGGTAMEAVVQLWNHGAVWDAGTLGALAGMMVAGTATAFGLYLQGVNMTGPLEGNVMGSVGSASAVVISVFWLRIRLMLSDLLGFVPILGVAFVLTSAYR